MKENIINIAQLIYYVPGPTTHLFEKKTFPKAEITTVSISEVLISPFVLLLSCLVADNDTISLSQPVAVFVLTI